MHAQAGGLVPCAGNECGTCHIVQLADNVIDIIISIALGLSVLIFIYAGWLMLSAAGNATQIKRGKDVMLNVLIGLVIILTAWLMVDVMLKTLLPGGNVSFGNNITRPWNQIVCSTQTDLKDAQPNWPGSSGWRLVEAIDTFGDPSSPFANASIVSTTECEPTPAGNRNCTAALASCPSGTQAEIDARNSQNHYVNCVNPNSAAPPTFNGTPAVACNGNTCAAITIPCGPSAGSNANCTISPDMVDRLSAFHAAAGINGARVTEGYPPTRTHKSQCHYNGTCIDYSKAGGMTTQEVLSAYNAAVNNGLRPVYEVGNEARRQELINSGVPAGAVKNYGSWISGEHFSIYGY